MIFLIFMFLIYLGFLYTNNKIKKGGIFKVLFTAMFFNFYVIYMSTSLKFGVLILEGWIMILITFESILNFDLTYFFSFYILGSLSFFSASFLIIKDFNFIFVLLFILIFKSLIISFLVLVSKGLNNFSLSIIFYVLSSKSLIIFYGVVFSFSELSDQVFCFMYDTLGFLLVLSLWIFLVLLSSMLLVCKDLEGYFLTIFNWSSILILMSGFFNFKMFLMGFLMDCIFFIMFLSLNYLKMDFMNYLSISENWNFILVFLFLGNLLGMPPFPSFFMELNFVFSFYFFIKSFKFMFLGFLYSMLSLHFYIWFSYLGSVSSNPKNHKSFSDEGYVVTIMLLGVFMTLVFQFLYGL